MSFNSEFKGLKLLKKNPGNGRLNNFNDPVLNVLRVQTSVDAPDTEHIKKTDKGIQRTFIVKSRTRGRISQKHEFIQTRYFKWGYNELILPQNITE